MTHSPINAALAKFCADQPRHRSAILTEFGDTEATRKAIKHAAAKGILRCINNDTAKNDGGIYQSVTKSVQRKTISFTGLMDAFGIQLSGREIGVRSHIQEPIGMHRPINESEEADA